MKWIVPLVLSVWLSGCATQRKPPHKPHRHGSHQTHKMSNADDAATRALIKTLRE